MLPLPVDELLPRVLAEIGAGRNLVIGAPPGSGKSTRVPPALVRALPGQVYLLQPRRIAAKALARRIAQEQTEAGRPWQLGREVGFRVRFERSGTAATRLWVMTEGSLTRQLQSDPYLEGVGCVILDEFHERSLHVDLALAYLRELQLTVRPDLRLVAMSATADAAPVAAFLGGAAGAPGESAGCAVIEAAGTLFPVATRHADIDQRQRLEDRVARAVFDAIADPEGGDILVFLPGAGEIRACERALVPAVGAHIDVLQLHGGLGPDEQDRALLPSTGGRRRVVLATNVAETSLTIPGVRTVIDSGLVRVISFDPATGVEELRLEPISRQSARQRAGRAGRTAPGTCVRMWTPLAEREMPEASLPEVRRVDLAPPLVALKRWGHADARRFPWFEPPQDDRLEAGERLLSLLGATAEAHGPLTELGNRLADLPLHPRLGRLMMEAATAHCPRLGATLAALLGERDLRLRRTRDDAPAEPAAADALERLELLEQAERARHQGHLRASLIDPQASQQVARARDETLAAWMSASGQASGKHAGWRVAEREREPEADAALVCRLLLASHPDRVARRSAADPNRAMMVGGAALEIDRHCALFADRAQRGSLFVAVEVQLIERGGRMVAVVRQGAEIDEALLTSVVPNAVVRRQEPRYDAEARRVVTAIRWCYRDLALREAGGAAQDVGAASEMLARALAPEARAIVEADEAARDWLRREAWLGARRPELGLPAFGDVEFAAIVAECAAGCVARGEVEAKPKLPWLQARLSREQLAAVDEEAPSHLAVPSGSRVKLDYPEAPGASSQPAESVGPPEMPAPVLAVRLQELFGLPATPRIAGGRVPVLLHLLAPNYRVEQVTTDLASFWANTYAHVRKDLRGRYPKHSWPDDPLAAVPQAKGRPRP